MSGIQSSVGLFSGIDTKSLIDQLIAADSGPKTLVQKQVVTIQAQQAAFLGINSKLGALKAAASNLGLNRVFDSSIANASDATVLGATASAGSPSGSYSFLVDRLVTTQQALTRGFADADQTGVGLTKLVFESAAGRLDSRTKLAGLNGGAGIVRGKITVTDSSGAASTVDLTRVETVDEVVRAINDSTAGRAVARAEGDRLIVTDAGGGSGTLSITDAPGTTGTRDSLGLGSAASGAGTGATVTGAAINRLGTATTLASLNDGLGVQINTASGVGPTDTPDFQIVTRDGSTLSIDIGDIFNTVGTTVTRTSTAVSDLTGVIDRINTQGGGKVTAAIGPSGVGLRLVDNTAGAGTLTVSDLGGRTTARDLGIAGSSAGGTIDGSRLIAALGSTLTRNLLGGSGVADGAFTVTAHDGSSFVFSADTSGSVADLIKSVSTATGGAVTLELDRSGTGLVLRDNTSGGTALVVAGAGATSLGLVTAGTSSATVQGSRLQHKFIGQATSLASLNGGKGIGTGQFSITDSYGVKRTINISSDLRTVGDVMAQINSASGTPNVRARINDTGDGLLLEEVARDSGPGSAAISVTDSNGAAAKLLGIAGAAAGSGVQNKIDGSFEKTVTVSTTDTLQQIADKINGAGVNAVAALINDGAPGQPYRLSLASRTTGDAGRFTVDSGAVDLQLTSLAEGSNARVFYGSSDPAKALLLSSTTNSVSGVVQGLSLDLKSASATPITVSVTTDVSAITKGINDFVTAYNTAANSIDTLSSYDPTSNKRGTLLGDSLALQIRNDLSNTVLGTPKGVTGRFQYLTQVGLSFDQNGNLSLDPTRLQAALQEDSQAVRDLFSAKAQASSSTQKQLAPGVFATDTTPGEFTSQGVAEEIASLVDKYIRPVDGVLSHRDTTFNDQIKAGNDRIATLDDRLTAKRAVLEQQFLAMEQAIGNLQNQSSALAGLSTISLA